MKIVENGVAKAYIRVPSNYIQAESGKTTSISVSSETANVQFTQAAFILREFIRKCTGVTLKMLAATNDPSKPPAPNCIFIQDYSHVNDSGTPALFGDTWPSVCQVKGVSVSPNRLDLIGCSWTPANVSGDIWTAVWAVAEFLERYMKSSPSSPTQTFWRWPNNNYFERWDAENDFSGIVTPKLSTFEVPDDIDYVWTHPMDHVQWANIERGQIKNWLAWHRISFNTIPELDTTVPKKMPLNRRPFEQVAVVGQHDQTSDVTVDNIPVRFPYTARHKEDGIITPPDKIKENTKTNFFTGIVRTQIDPSYTIQTTNPEDSACYTPGIYQILHTDWVARGKPDIMALLELDGGGFHSLIEPLPLELVRMTTAVKNSFFKSISQGKYPPESGLHPWFYENIERLTPVDITSLADNPPRFTYTKAYIEFYKAIEAYFLQKAQERNPVDPTSEPEYNTKFLIYIYHNYYLYPLGYSVDLSRFTGNFASRSEDSVQVSLVNALEWKKTNIELRWRPNIFYTQALFPFNRNHVYPMLFTLLYNMAGVRTMYLDGFSEFTIFGIQGFGYYSLARVTYSGKVVNEVEEEYYNSFGIVKNNIRAFHELSQQITLRFNANLADDPNQSIRDIILMPKYLNRNDLDQMRECFTLSQEILDTISQDELDGFNYLKAGFELTEKAWQFATNEIDVANYYYWVGQHLLQHSSIAVFERVYLATGKGTPVAEINFKQSDIMKEGESVRILVSDESVVYTGTTDFGVFTREEGVTDVNLLRNLYHFLVLQALPVGLNGIISFAILGYVLKIYRTQLSPDHSVTVSVEKSADFDAIVTNLGF